MANRDQLKRVSPLTLGTVQLGLAYGVSNTAGKPSEDEAFTILLKAASSGISTLDTARAYGDSEAVIGRWLKSCPLATRPLIVTKVKAVPEGTRQERREWVRASLTQSRDALGLEKLDLVLTHRGKDLLDDDVHDLLLEEKAAGLIGGIGASLYTPDVGLELFDHRDFDALQLPFSAVDDRFERSGILEKARRNNVVVFGRSIFLQGALLMTADRLPQHLSDLRTPLLHFHQLARSLAVSPSELLLRFGMSAAGLSSVLIGVETADQLDVHLKAAARPPLEPSVREAVKSVFSGLPPNVIDPSQWPRH